MKTLTLILTLMLVSCSHAEIRQDQSESSVPSVHVTEVDRYIGNYLIEVVWTDIDISGPRKWNGTVNIARKDGGDYSGTMRLICTNMEWIVDQDIKVSIENDIISIQGSNVREVKKPQGRGGYGWDLFILKNRDGIWISGDASGENEVKGVVKLYRNDAV